MFHVNLELKNLNLEIIQPVTVQFLIRKDHSSLSLPNTFFLLNSKAEMNQSFQFHISSTTPQFQILVILRFQLQSKLAGVILINLLTFAQDEKHNMTKNLMQSIDQNSSIQISLFYQLSSSNFLKLDLAGQKEIAAMNAVKKKSQALDLLKGEEQRNIKLKQKYNSLLFDHQLIWLQFKKMQQKESQENQSWLEEFNRQQSRYNNIKDHLVESKLVMGSIFDLILESGDAKLVNQIQELIHQRQNQSQQPQ